MLVLVVAVVVLAPSVAALPPPPPGWGPCFEARANSRPNGFGFVGAYAPQCQQDGTYEQRQCHGSTGYCWCVDTWTGVEVPGSRRGPGGGEVMCDQPLGPCAGWQSIPAPGAYTPQCDSQGNFQPKQCHGSTGQCWCVDPETGAEVPGSRTYPGQTARSCTTNSAPAPPPLPVIGARPCDQQNANKVPAPGAYIAQCDVAGYWKPRQCNASTGWCWCVNTETGIEIPGSRAHSGFHNC